MEYSERIAIRDFVLDYLIEDGGVIEAEADRVQRLGGRLRMVGSRSPARNDRCLHRRPDPPGRPGQPPSVSLLFCVFDPADHCEDPCDLTLWYERIVKEAAA